jgi:hypothetical protein
MRAKLLIIFGQVFQVTSAGAASPFLVEYIFRDNVFECARIDAEDNLRRELRVKKSGH